MIKAEEALVIANIVIIIIWILHFLRVGKLLKKSDERFKITQIDFELAVQEQKRNQAESDVTQLRIKKAEFITNGKFKGCVENIICYRLKQYEKCRIPEIVKRIEELKKEKEKAGNYRK